MRAALGRAPSTTPDPTPGEPVRGEPVGEKLDAGSGPGTWTVDDLLRSDGVNVVGYLRKQLALGDAGRQIVSSLIDAGITTSPLAFGASPSPVVDPPFPLTQRIAFRSTIAVVAADQMPVLNDWHPEVFAADGRRIGYCFWELSRLSDAGVRGVELLDEVWAPTLFIASVFERLGTIPVRHVPLPVPEPMPSAREREQFEPLSSAGDRVVLGVTFDYFSVLERKNPLGAVAAFTRAFSPDEGPLLVIKTLNADAHPVERARLLDAIGARRDIVVWDALLDTADQFAFLSHLDVLVSLHRGEGLGKHLAEAMWLGVACIATDYSGNVDFMDDTCARMIGHTLIDVQQGGTIYPDGTRWADPDLDDAAAAMRELADDPDLRRALGARARERMSSRSGAAALVDAVRSLT